MRKLILLTSASLLFAASAHSQTSDGKPRFMEADINGDGQIQLSEVERMIDGYFIGEHDRGVMYIHSLIDFYFEQDL